MNYIYDVIANFNDIPYDFFEWNKIDDITHLKKVIIIKTDSQVLNDLINKKVKVSEDLLKYIKNKTEFYSKSDSNLIAIFTNGYINICIKFTKDGINKYKSFLQIEEDDEVLELSNRLNEIDFNYQIFGEANICQFKTRKETEAYNYIVDKIDDLYNKNDVMKLKYIYYDCFDKFEDNKNKIYEEIKQSINDNFEVLNKIYDFFKLISLTEQR
ncbi:MAG: hypothetical protein MR227_01550 [Firmicutes bacterium]|nr:hypothetical protein [Bacillota bacterium]